MSALSGAEHNSLLHCTIETYLAELHLERISKTLLLPLTAWMELKPCMYIYTDWLSIILRMRITEHARVYVRTYYTFAGVS